MKSYLDVIEARAKIKFSPKSPKKERRRYEVNVIIKTREGIRVFQDSGWDLPDIFDSIGLRIKRILAQSIQKGKGENSYFLLFDPEKATPKSRPNAKTRPSVWIGYCCTNS